MAEAFKLPGSSYDELAKIIAAYSNVPGEVSPGDVAKLVGTDPTAVSRNNAFLAGVGIIEERKGGKKVPTDLGRDLGRALEHNLSDRVQELWRTVVVQNDFLRQLISAVRIRNGMDPSSFISHVGYSAGQPRGGRTSLGGRAILAILVTAGVVQSADGKIVPVTTADVGHKTAQESETTQSTVPATRHLAPVAGAPQEPSFEHAVVIRLNVNVTAEDIEGIGLRLRRELDALHGPTSEPDPESGETD